MAWENMPVPQLAAYALATLFGYYFANCLWVALGPRLSKFPGPFIARFTQLFLAKHAFQGDAHFFYRKLHDQYGKIVRSSPNTLSIGDPSMIPIIYGIGSKFNKSDFYDSFAGGPVNGKTIINILAIKDTSYHRKYKGSIASAYSLSSLRQLEPLIDECSAIFMTAMTELRNEHIDLGEWIQWYAFDVIGMISFCKSFGFMEKRADYNGIIHGLEVGIVYSSIIGMIPELHKYLVGNATLMKLLGKIPAIAKLNPVAQIDVMTNEAISLYDSTLDKKKQRGDHLEFFRKVQEKEPGRLSEGELKSALIANLAAGSDTTAMSLRSVFYHLIKYPRVYDKLKAEIDQAERAGELSEYVEYAQSLKLEYLQAVIKEAMRLHPGVALPLQRLVPEGGAELCGMFVPENTVVGINPWVVHHDKDIYGQDTDIFRPERWLEANPERLKLMERAFFTFGYGARACLGKNISILEMNKFVPQVLRQFDIEWASPNDEWKVAGYWFPKQTGLVVKMLPKVNQTTD